MDAPKISTSFWSTDYLKGITAAIAIFRTSVKENEQLINTLKAYTASFDKQSKSIRAAIPLDEVDSSPAYASLVATLKTALTEQANAFEIVYREGLAMSLDPFLTFCLNYSEKVSNANTKLTKLQRAWFKEVQNVAKRKSTYYNRARVFEEGPPRTSGQGLAEASNVEYEQEDDDLKFEDQFLELAGQWYSKDEVAIVLKRMISEIPQTKEKIRVLGTFDHVVQGDVVVTWMLNNLLLKSVREAESLGQSLIQNGFLRHLGMGWTFANSGVMLYQWKNKAYEFANIKYAKSSEILANKSKQLPLVGEWLAQSIQNISTLDDTPEQKLRRELEEADCDYQKAVAAAESARMELEENIEIEFDNLQSLEIERYSRTQKCIKDLLDIVQSKINTAISSLDPAIYHFSKDLNGISNFYETIISKSTGSYLPKPIVYENYFYHNAENLSVFGTDLELQCRAEKTEIPPILRLCLEILSSRYSLVSSSHELSKVWCTKLPLSQIHQWQIFFNNSVNVTNERLEKLTLNELTNLIWVYLLELPESLIPSGLNDQIFSIFRTETSNQVTDLQVYLKQLTFSNLKTLQHLCRHLNTWLALLDPQDIQEALSKVSVLFCDCIIRPNMKKTVDSLDNKEVKKKFMTKLIENCQTIFAFLDSSTPEKNPEINQDGNASSYTSSVRHVSFNEHNMTETATITPEEPASSISVKRTGALKINKRLSRSLPDEVKLNLADKVVNRQGNQIPAPENSVNEELD